MGLFGSNKVERKLDLLNRTLAHSFQNVKQDTSRLQQDSQKLFEWINYLHFQNQQMQQQNQKQQQLINQLSSELQEIPKSKEEIKMIIDSYYSFDSITERINNLNNRLDQLVSAQNPIIDNIREMHSKIDQIEKRPEPRTNLKERILKRITKNSKSYVKNLILSFIRKYGKMSGLQLRELIVEEQELCSKSSFYRILEEIEQEDDISVISDGKQKHFIFKIQSKNRY